MPASPPPRLSALFFDLDGTLIDSREDIASAANYALEAHGLPTRTTTELASFVGDGACRLIERASQWTPDAPGFAPLLATFHERYLARAVVSTRPYPGVRKTLIDLRHRWPELQLAVCTNKPRQITDRVLGQLELDSYFAGVVGGDDLPTRKPDPAPVLWLCDALNVPPQACLLIGDGAQDVLAGQRAGTRTAGVRYGIKSEDLFETCAPDYDLDRFEQLSELLLELLADGVA